MATDIFPASGTSLETYPIYENTRVAFGSLTVSVKLPFTSEIAPVIVPLTRTFTPGNGWLFDASVIVPETFTCCGAATVPVVLLPEGFSVAVSYTHLRAHE